MYMNFIKRLKIAGKILLSSKYLDEKEKEINSLRRKYNFVKRDYTAAAELFEKFKNKLICCKEDNFIPLFDTIERSIKIEHLELDSYNKFQNKPDDLVNVTTYTYDKDNQAELIYQIAKKTEFKLYDISNQLTRHLIDIGVIKMELMQKTPVYDVYKIYINVMKKV